MDAAEPRPLEGISSIADNLTRMADELDAWLDRFNGPATMENETVASSRAYRSEIGRLDALTRRFGGITDSILKIG